MATARNIIVNLLTYFSNNKNWNHTIRLYRNVPISHIRVSNPKRTYIRDYAFYINYFQSLTVEKVTSILNILEKSLNIVGNRSKDRNSSNININTNPFNYFPLLTTSVWKYAFSWIKVDWLI